MEDTGSLGPIVTLLASAGFLGGMAALLKAWLDHRKGVRQTEADAEQRHIERLERRNDSLEKRIDSLSEFISKMERERESLMQYNAMLLTHIAQGSPPPPPQRPDF